MRLLTCRIVAIALLAGGPLATLACGSESGGAAASDEATSSSPAALADTIAYDQQRSIDLTGDGAPEVVRLHGAGAQWNALTVQLEIRSRDSLLYADTFNTSAYAGGDPDQNPRPSELADWIKQELAKNLADAAFGQQPDFKRTNVRAQYDVARWETAHHAPIPRESDAAFDSAVRSVGTTPQEYARFERDLLAHPMYKYYVGGLSYIGLSWSSMLGRFVRTWDCC